MRKIDVKEISEKFQIRTSNLIKKHDLKLTICFVFHQNSNEASVSYFKSLQKIAEKIGITIYSISLSDEYMSIFETMERLNRDNTIDGIIVDQPCKDNIQNLIRDNKDIEGANYSNFAKTIKGEDLPSYNFKSPTTLAVQEIINHERIILEGKNVLVIGRSNNVGKQVGINLMNVFDCNVTFTHSKTDFDRIDLKSFDLIVSAAGSPFIFSFDDFSDEAIVLDLSYNFVEGMIVGDIFKIGTVNLYTDIKGGISVLTSTLIMTSLVLKTIGGIL